jgi:hypothetical protein
MEASKQSEVARKVAAIGLVESSSPPFRIVVPAGRLDGAELEAMPVLTADTLAARAARDSAASLRADSLLGRARRQATGTESPAGELEAGPPPPGPEEDDTEGVELAKSAAPVVPREKKSSKKSLKKSKSVQSEGVGNTHKAKSTNSAGSTKNSKKAATNERKR